MGTLQAKMLGWNEVQDAAKELFNIWTHRQELVWAEKAWTIMLEAGLTSYTTEYGRCRVALYLLGLSSLYYDFCWLGCDERQTPNYMDAADLLGLTPFRMGQIVAADPDFLDGGEEIFFDALEIYAKEQRSALCGPLIRNSCLDFYNELWYTVAGLPNDEEDEADLNNVDLPWSVSDHQVRVYAWIVDGCYSIF